DLHDHGQRCCEQRVDEAAVAHGAAFHAPVIAETFSALNLPLAPRAFVSTSIPRKRGCEVSAANCSGFSAEMPPASRIGFRSAPRYAPRDPSERSRARARAR